MAATHCQTWEYSCRDGGCVQSYSHCDGHFQCDDGSDEKGCLHVHPVGPSAEGSCGDGLFQCRDGTCIFRDWRCDYEVDCRDGSDEDTCGTADRGSYVALTNIAAAAVASTVAVILIGLAVASVVHFYRKRQKADAMRAVRCQAMCRDDHAHPSAAETLYPVAPPTYALYNQGYVPEPCSPPSYGQCVDPPPEYSEINEAVAMNSDAHEDEHGKESSNEDRGGGGSSQT